MPKVTVAVSGFSGMERTLPSTSLEIRQDTGLLVPYELVNMDASQLPRLRPRPAMRFISEPTGADLVWPRLY